MLNHLKVTYSNTTPDNVEFMANNAVRNHLEPTIIRSKPIKNRTDLTKNKVLPAKEISKEKNDTKEHPVSYDFVGVAG
jgi:hypothetical protein